MKSLTSNNKEQGFNANEERRDGGASSSVRVVASVCLYSTDGLKTMFEDTKVERIVCDKLPIKKERQCRFVV